MSDAESDKKAAYWLSRVLTGREEIPTGRDDRHALDAVFGQWRAGKDKERIQAGFRGLLTSDAPKLRAAAVHFYTRFLVPDDGAVARAKKEHPELYRGVTSDWYPGNEDLAEMLHRARNR